MGFSTIGGAGGGSEETPSGGAGSSGHEGVDDQSSSNDDQITIKDTEVVINEDGDDVDFRVESDTKDNSFVVQGSDGKIGFGVSSPQKCLSASGGGSDGTLQLTTTSSGVGGTDGFHLASATSGAAYINQREASDLTVIVNGTTTMTYKNGGNVGIGTTDPDSLLEVAKASADAEVLISAYHDTEATTPKLTFRKADNTEASPALVDDDAVLGTISFQGHDGSGFEQGAKIEARVNGTPSDGSDMPTELTFWTTPNASATSTERFSIDGSGRVGIGTVSQPQTASGLEIFKDLGTPDDLSDFSDYHLVLKGGYGTGDYAAMMLSSSVDGNGGSAIAHIDTGGAGKGDLVFYTQQGTAGAAPVEGMRLGSDGAVALKSIASVPAITSGSSKLFAKSDIGLDTAVLMHFDNNWNDSGVWGLAAGTASGDPSFVTSSPSPKFGTHCAYFDGTGDFVDLDGDSDDPALGLGYDEWTIDFWASFPSGSLAANDTMIQSGATATSTAEGSWRIHLGQTDSAGDSIAVDLGSTFVETLKWDYGSEIADDKTWYHFALVQHGGTISFFLNGTKKASAENTNRLYTHAGIRLGADQGGSGDAKFYMEELRISKKAQWFNNFTPPTVAYGDSTLQCIDAHGNHTRLSPHNAEGEWEYFSQNSLTGKTVRINMEEVVSDLGKLTGKNYIKDE